LFVGLSGTIAGGRLFVLIDRRVIWQNQIIVLIAFYRIRAVILVCVTLSIGIVLFLAAWLGRAWISTFGPIVFSYHVVSPPVAQELRA
jgi:hypothetical protein